MRETKKNFEMFEINCIQLWKSPIVTLLDPILCRLSDNGDHNAETGNYSRMITLEISSQSKLNNEHSEEKTTRIPLGVFYSVIQMTMITKTTKNKMILVRSHRYTQRTVE